MSPTYLSWFAVSLALVFLLASAAFADDYGDAVQLLKNGDTAAALRKADAAIAANKNDPRARFLKGLILTERNDTAGAIQVFTALTRDYPELPEPYNNLAVLYAAQGQYDEARESLEMAIRTHPSYAVAHENLGDVYAKMASEAYDKALSLDRSNRTAQTKLSMIRELFSGSEPLAPVQTAAVPAAAPTTTASATDVAPAQKSQADQSKSGTRATQSTAPAASSSDQSNALILATVGNWASAWSNQDVDTYLTHYATNFETPAGMSRADWEKQRRDRLTRPKFIKVTVSNAKVSVSGEKSASVRFRQQYKSDSIDSSGFKTLTLTKSDDGWLIVKEAYEN